MAPYEYFEGLMLLCFAVGWIWSIARTLKARSAGNRSAFLGALICSGYVLGIFSKLLLWQHDGTLSPLTWLYVCNLAITGIDLALVLHYAQPRRAATAR